jgi:uncharacterized protein YndB with AHSA1/START domain
LAEPFAISLPAISRHLKVLENAGLVSRSRSARNGAPSASKAPPLRDRRHLARALPQILGPRASTRWTPSSNDLTKGKPRCSQKLKPWPTLNSSSTAPLRHPLPSSSACGERCRIVQALVRPKDFTCPSYSLDFRVGGAYRGMIRSAHYPDGWFGGTFKEIVPNQKIVMSFAWEQGSGLTDRNDITITLSEADGVTIQRFHQAPFGSIEERDSHLSGWTECLDKQVSYSRANPA